MAHDVNQSERDVAAQVRSALVERISSERYDLWIPESTQWRFHQDVLTLSFESDFSCQLAKRMLCKDLGHVTSQVLAKPIEVLFQVADSGPVAIAPKEAEIARKPAEVKASEDLEVRAATRVSEPSLPPTIDLVAPPDSTSRPAADRQPMADSQWGSQFIRGDCNQLAWATAKLVVAEPGKLSPVLLHGPSGAGKSLLANVIAQQLRGARRLRRVVHMTSEQFTNDFTDGLRGGGLPMFRRKYRDVEALMLEDIQFFVGKKSTLTEVKHTLDNLLRLGKQVVFTADRSLNDLQSLGSDLIGRIRGGLTAPIFPLDEPTRLAFLRREIDAAGIHTGDHVLQEIASRSTGDGRVLSGIVKRLTAVAAFESRKLNWERCWSAIHDLVQATQPVVRIVDIERVVCDVFGLEPDSLQSSSKIRRVSQPRMLAMFLARKYTPAAYKEIGQYFGKRRHSTVISAEKTVEAWLDHDSNLDDGRGLKVRDAIRHVESQLQVG